MDTFTAKHFSNWCESMRLDEETVSAMLARFADDPDYYCANGWRVLYDATWRAA